MKWLLVAFTVILAGAAIGEDAPSDPNRLNADLTFNFVCKEKSPSILETEFDVFLRKRGFRVLNLARIQPQHQLNVDIIGLDERRRIFKMISFPLAKDKYALAFYTPPPTQRVLPLEEAILAFVSNTLGCVVSQVARRQNKVDAKSIYDKEVRRIEGLLRQGNELRGERRI